MFMARIRKPNRKLSKDVWVFSKSTLSECFGEAVYASEHSNNRLQLCKLRDGLVETIGSFLSACLSVDDKIVPKLLGLKSFKE
jgi:hypothetical protein